MFDQTVQSNANRALKTGLRRCAMFAVAISAASLAKADDSNAAKAIGLRAKQKLGTSRYALVIGINDYASPDISDLKFAEADAQSIYDTLTNPDVGGIEKTNARLLMGEAATCENIKKELVWLNGTPKDATVFIFFSGHGAKEGGEAFWVAQDSKLGGLSWSAMADADIRRFTDKIQSSRLIMMLDCCYAAATVKNQKAIVDFTEATRGFTGKGRVTIAASGSGEESIESANLKHGVFAHYLVKGMTGEADGLGGEEDGVITVPELTDYIGKHVADVAHQHGGIQKPAIFMDEVQEPEKFLITIDPARIEKAEQKAQAMEAETRARVESLRTIFNRDEIDANQFALGKRLFETPPPKLKLNKPDSERLEAFLELISGELQPKHLAATLSDIDSKGEEAAQPNAAEKVKEGVRNRIDQLVKADNFAGAEPELTRYEKTYGQDKYSTDVRAELKRLAPVNPPLANPPPVNRPRVQPPAPAPPQAVAKRGSQVLLGQVDSRTYKSYPGAVLPMYVVLQSQSNREWVATAGKRVNVWVVVEKGGQKMQTQSVVTDGNGRATFSITVPNNARSRKFFVYREFEGDSELAPAAAKEVTIGIGSPPKSKSKPTRTNIRLPGGFRLP